MVFDINNIGGELVSKLMMEVNKPTSYFHLVFFFLELLLALLHIMMASLKGLVWFYLFNLSLMLLCTIVNFDV